MAGLKYWLRLDIINLWEENLRAGDRLVLELVQGGQGVNLSYRGEYFVTK